MSFKPRWTQCELRNVQAWTRAIEAELEALFSRKEALKEISEEERKRLESRSDSREADLHDQAGPCHQGGKKEGLHCGM